MNILHRTIISVVKTAVLFFLTVVLLRFAVLQLGDFDYARGVGQEQHQTDNSELTGLQAIFDGRVLNFSGIGLNRHLRNLGMTGIMVLLGLIVSTGFSLLLGYYQARKPHSAWWDAAAGMGTLISGIPLFIVGLMAFFLLPRNDSTWVILVTLCAGGGILGSFEGALSEGPRNFRLIFGELQDRTYYLACRARGQSTLGIHYRAIRPFLVRSLGTRISYLFGGTVIVETTMGIGYLGFTFGDSLLRAGNYYDYCDAMISGLLLMAVPLAVRMILDIISQQKTEVRAIPEPIPGT